MSLLTLVQDACDMLSVSRPSSVIAAADQNARTLLACAQREGKALAERWTWQALAERATFTSIAAETQTNALPLDFDRLVSNTFFNVTLKRPVFGPLTPQEWEAHTALTAQLLFDSFRIWDTDIQLKPIPSAGWTYAFEYMSANWCRDAGSTVTRAAWLADDDVGLLSEELMTLGVIWRFKQSRGLSFDDDRMEYEMRVRTKIARDGGRRTISLSGSHDVNAPRYPGVPDGSWNL